jgi:hypothetical protein
MKLVDIIQEEMHIAPLKKIDPNTQQPITNSDSKMAQAVIPSVLAALYKFSLKDHGAGIILSGKNSTTWVNMLFGNNAKTALQRMSNYSASSFETVQHYFEKVAEKSVRFLNSLFDNNTSIENVRSILNDNKNDVLTYLPAELQMGKLLEDNTIDDRTNKMEGPVSGLMHTIEKAFSGGTNKNSEDKTNI